MYFPDHPEDHDRYETRPMLTFLVSLRVVRRLEVVPSNAVIASETVNIRHRVHSSPKYTGQNISPGTAVLEVTRTEELSLLYWPI